MYKIIRFESMYSDPTDEINNRLREIEGKVTDIKIEKEPKYYATMVTITYEELANNEDV